MSPRRYPLLFALSLALCLVLAQLAVAVHGVVHPTEHPGTSHAPVCKHLNAHALGSALPASNTLDFHPAACSAPQSTPLRATFLACIPRYQSRAPPLPV
jgi:hypothetical protein